MKRLVLKFGGTSVGSIAKIKNVANIVKQKREEGNEVIVVVSAMSGVTNDLISKSNCNPTEIKAITSSAIGPCMLPVDKEGNPSTNPDDFFDGGAHLPFGGHKGYTLMMAAEFLGRIFSGSDEFVDDRR